MGTVEEKAISLSSDEELEELARSLFYFDYSIITEFLRENEALSPQHEKLYRALRMLYAELMTLDSFFNERNCIDACAMLGHVLEIVENTMLPLTRRRR